MKYEKLGSAAAILVASGTALMAAYTDPAILTIEGQSRVAAERYPVDRLRSDFENLEIETRTPWTREREQIKYRGPRILDVLREHGMDTKNLGSVRRLRQFHIGNHDFGGEDLQSHLRNRSGLPG